MPLSPNQTLNNRYRITALIGQGGMGAVYDGWDSNLNIRVAIKENLLITEASRRQFEREAHVLAGLRHSNLPSVIDHFYIQGQGQYLVMSFIEGEDLKERLQRLGPLPEADVLRWADEVLGALAYLHKRDVIHRDIKPNNIKITPEGEAVLVDFGLAKEIVDEAGMTTTGARGLTPGFAPPEQYGAGLGRTDARSDIYAFGATLYVLLTSEAPADALSRLGNPSKYVPVSRHPVKVSKVLAQAIDRALELKPEKRFQSAEEMRGGVKTPAPTPKPKPVKPKAQNDTVPVAGVTNVGETNPTQRTRKLLIPLASLIAIVVVGLLTVAAIAVATSLGQEASVVATTTPELTVTKRVATATVRVTNTIVPSKTAIPPTATASLISPTETISPSQTAIPPSATQILSTNTRTPQIGFTKVVTNTPTSKAVANIGEGSPPVITDVRINFVDKSYVAVEVTYSDFFPGSNYISSNDYNSWPVGAIWYSIVGNAEQCPGQLQCQPAGDFGVFSASTPMNGIIRNVGLRFDNIFCGGGAFTTNTIEVMVYRNEKGKVRTTASSVTLPLTVTWCQV